MPGSRFKSAVDLQSGLEAWEKEAIRALEEVERLRHENGSLRRRLAETQEREDRLERDVVLLADKLAETTAVRAGRGFSGESDLTFHPGHLDATGTPLIKTTMTFGPKSSYGSVQSPVKSRGSQLAVETSYAPSLPARKPSQGQFNRARLPAALPVEEAGAHRDSLDSASQRSWEPKRSHGSSAGLNEADENFLNDLSAAGDERHGLVDGSEDDMWE